MTREKWEFHMCMKCKFWARSWCFREGHGKLVSCWANQQACEHFVGYHGEAERKRAFLDPQGENKVKVTNQQPTQLFCPNCGTQRVWARQESLWCSRCRCKFQVKWFKITTVLLDEQVATVKNLLNCYKAR